MTCDKKQLEVMRIKLLHRSFCVFLCVCVAIIGFGCGNGDGEQLEVEPTPTAFQILIIQQTHSPSPTIEPSPTQPPILPLTGVTIGIDPGHQAIANNELEPVYPKSKKSQKEKVSPGTKGFWSDVNEYVIVLEVALFLQDILEENGATVIMTRTTNEVDISNIERANIMNQAETDYALRIHCNGSHDQTKKGASVLIPKKNPFQQDCKNAAEILLAEFCAETRIEYRGISERGDQTGFNWCNRMIINIELGYMSNREDDAYLTNPDNYKTMAQGLAKGIIRYFEQRGIVATETPTLN
jgi:N-acetylmuramoyl-L-alanine amidase